MTMTDPDPTRPGRPLDGRTAGEPATSSSSPSSPSPSVSSSGRSASSGPALASARRRCQNDLLRRLAAARDRRPADRPQAWRGALRRGRRGRRCRRCSAASGASTRSLSGVAPGRRARSSSSSRSAIGNWSFPVVAAAVARERGGGIDPRLGRLLPDDTTRRRSSVGGVHGDLRAVVILPVVAIALVRALAPSRRRSKDSPPDGRRPRPGRPSAADDVSFTYRRRPPAGAPRRLVRARCRALPARRRAVRVRQEHAGAGPRRARPARDPRGVAGPPGGRRRRRARHRPTPSRPRVGLLFQDPDRQLVMERVEDDVAFGLENRGWPRERDARPRAGGARGRRAGRVRATPGAPPLRRGAAAPRAGRRPRPAPGPARPRRADGEPRPGRRAPRSSSRSLAGARGERSTTIVLIEHHAEDRLAAGRRVLALGSTGARSTSGRRRRSLTRSRAGCATPGSGCPDEGPAGRPLLPSGAAAPPAGPRRSASLDGRSA